MDRVVRWVKQGLTIGLVTALSGCATLFVDEVVFNSPRPDPAAELQYMDIPPDKGLVLSVARDFRGPLKPLRAHYLGVETQDGAPYYRVLIEGTRSHCRSHEAVELLLPVHPEGSKSARFREAASTPAAQDAPMVLVFNPWKERGRAALDMTRLLPPDSFHDHPEKIVVDYEGEELAVEYRAGGPDNAIRRLEADGYDLQWVCRSKTRYAAAFLSKPLTLTFDLATLPTQLALMSLINMFAYL